MPAAGDLFDACAEAGEAGPRWRHGQPVLWLTTPYVRVADRTWRARASKVSADGTGRAVHGYSARQCRQVAEALRPVMGALAGLTGQHAATLAGHPGTQSG